jgi:signal transduction histidine kinase
VAGVAGVAVTVSVALSPGLSFSYHTAVGRTMLETTVTLVGGLTALLCVGRYRRSHAPSDLITAVAMATLAASFPLLAALPRLIAPEQGERFGVWALVCARVAAAALLVISGALAASSASRRPSPATVATALVPVIMATAAVPVLAWAAPRPAGVLTSVGVHAARPLDDPLVSGIQLGAAVLFVIAAIQFARRVRRQTDGLLGWMSMGCVLLAVGGVNYALSPSLELALLHTGDLFRAAAIVAFAGGAIAEIRSYWAGLAELARSQERRSLARDLHDGLTQELAFLVTRIRAPEGIGAPSGWRLELQSAAERALAESRRSIRALASDAVDPLGQDLRAVAREVLDRESRQVDLVTDMQAGGPAFSTRDQESVLRIVREAVSNAVRHGRATQITISVRGTRPCTMRVTDNGVGFDVARVSAVSPGFGLVSMRERAQDLGASFRIQSAPGAGTTVDLEWR